ncbi:serine hydrolase domain-containing protein [Saccharothrix violaceirubra]|uniref:D-alanyl-D-alanine carboxypeptidase n=1 Tax=Saccharothrix violaceirubra TaxID=413306 RepID=A0A7W7T5Q3_9PSEU|nr:serine hydrolase domain-containing protein [Saccharothrix violaceirubra]MBB4966447.1 D-alanyl-D-alanine carboxypeptidase [Saccharothrix violaceirubra]
MKRILMTATALCVAVGLAAGTASATSSQHRTLQKDADALVALGAPGVLVELDTPRGDVRVRSGYGDTARKTPVPWDARFRIGSFTKTYVATTVLLLAGEGRLSLDDTVERWLPGLVSGNGNDGRKITVRQLLQHTSGLHNYTRDLDWLSSREGFERNRFRSYTAEQVVREAVKTAPDFAPGTNWLYSNTGYALAGMIIEKATGRTWQQEVTARVLRPLRLNDTYSPGDSPFIAGPHAQGYQRFPDGGTPEKPTFGPQIDVTVTKVSWGGAAGDMIGTTDDGNRFLQALLGGKILKPAQLAEMKKTVPATVYQGWIPGLRYGLGLMWNPTSCGGSWSHGGDIPGFMTRNGVTDDGSRSVVVTLNTDSPIPADGTLPTKEISLGIVEHALCGTK